MRKWLTKRGHKKTLTEKYFERVVIGDGCWGWSGAVNGNGYGHLWGTRAHRISWRIFFGPIPDGMGVLHRCDNRICSNPAHLFLGDQKVNMMDCAAKGRNPAGRRITEAPSAVVPVAETSEAALIVVEDGPAEEFPAERRKRTKDERYWAKVVCLAHCWIWTGRRSRWLAGMAWKREYGRYPWAVVIDRWCKNDLCVNPEHLRPMPRRLRMTWGEDWRRPRGVEARKVVEEAGREWPVSDVWRYARRAVGEQVREVRRERQKAKWVQALERRRARKEAVEERRLRRQEREAAIVAAWVARGLVCPLCGKANHGPFEAKCLDCYRLRS